MDLEKLQQLYTSTTPRSEILKDFPDTTWAKIRSLANTRKWIRGVKPNSPTNGLLNVQEQERIVFWPDTHIPFQDKKAVEAGLTLLRKVKPTTFIQLGDLMDAYTISDHLRDPKRGADLQTEIDGAIEFWSEIRSVVGRNCKLIWRGGNHEDRLRKILWKHPEFAGLRDLSIPALCRLENSNVQWVDYGEKLILHNELMVPHGTAIRQNSGMSGQVELAKRGINGVSGHTHRASLTFTTNERGTLFWLESGHMSDFKQAKYMGDLRPNWQTAISQVDWDGIKFWPKLYMIQDGKINV